MTINIVYTIAGFQIDSLTLYQKCLESSHEFQKCIKDGHIHDDNFTFDEFYKFIMSLTLESKQSITNLILSELKKKKNSKQPITNLILDQPAKTLDPKERLMISMFNDSELCELSQITYPGTELKIYRMSHDVDKDENYIVGVEIMANSLRRKMETTLDELSSRIDNAKLLLTEAGIKDYRVYVVQDECSCCH